MTLNTKKYLITTEKHEVFVIHNGNKAIYEFCAECEKIVEMLNLDTATTQTGIRTREVLSLIELGEIHSIETENGHLIICKNSLFGR
jgi:hypothetical protein